LHYGKVLDRVLYQILISDPAHGPIYQLKYNMADGYYCLGLVPRDAPKLSVVFSSDQKEHLLVSIPLILPMVWINSGSAFCTATKTIADVANAKLHRGREQPPHHLNDKAPQLEKIQVIQSNSHTESRPLAVAAITRLSHSVRNPLLHRKNPKYLASIDVFVDNFVALVQGCKQQLL